MFTTLKTCQNSFSALAMLVLSVNSYRKALRMMKYADHHGLPIITFVDTPGAFADVKSEELGQVSMKHSMLYHLCLFMFYFA